MKTVFSVIGIILLCLVILGQVMKEPMKSSEERAEFARLVERADRDCPIPAAMGKGAVTSIRLEDKQLTYYLSYDTDVTNVLSRLNDDEKAKETMLMFFLCINAQGGNRGDWLMEKLIKFGYGFKVVITESANGRSSYSATADEIKTLRAKYKLNPQEAFYNILEISAEAERESLPMEIDEGMLMTDYRLEGENIVITIILDESMIDIDELYDVRKELKDFMLEDGLSNPDTKALLDMCKVSHTGLIYRMFGSRTKKKLEISIPSDEIRRIVPTPSNAHIQ